ncbi:MAG TPA: hypothetical protein VM536_08755 [Chloroflexia bacterium]|nr:hypothetical protein [Chloroflexia bacterium]
MTDEPLKISLPVHVARRVHTRGVATVVIGRDLERYYLLLAEARYRLRGHFSDGEINLITHSLTEGMLWDALSVTSFATTIAGAIKGRPSASDQAVDRASLTAKLHALDAVETAAFVDALEQFWLEAWDSPNWSPGTDLWDTDG